MENNPWKLKLIQYVGYSYCKYDRALTIYKTDDYDIYCEIHRLYNTCTIRDIDVKGKIDQIIIPPEVIYNRKIYPITAVNTNSCNFKTGLKKLFINTTVDTYFFINIPIDFLYIKNIRNIEKFSSFSECFFNKMIKSFFVKDYNLLMIKNNDKKWKIN